MLTADLRTGTIPAANTRAVTGASEVPALCEAISENTPGIHEPRELPRRRRRVRP